MMLPVYFKELDSIDNNILTDLENHCNKVVWDSPSFDRSELPLLEGRTLVFPFATKPKNYIETEDAMTLMKICEPVIDQISKHYPDCKLIRGDVATLLPGRKLHWHIDNLWMHRHSHRIHVPVITDKNCYHLWPSHAAHMERGKLYELNNLIRHSAFNYSDKIRVHIIFDLCPNEKWNNLIETGGNWYDKVCEYTDEYGR